MANQETDMHVTKPPFRWEVNINTLIVVAGFIFTWGVTYATLENGRSTNADNIERLEIRLGHLEGTQRTLENHEIRLSNVEAQARDAATAMRTVEASLSGLSADMRVIREILSRLEQNGPRPQ